MDGRRARGRRHALGDADEVARRRVSAMLALFDERKPVDLVAVWDRLQDMGRLESVGGKSYPIALQELAPTAAAVETYAAIVREKADLRRLLLLGEQLRQAVHDAPAAAPALSACQLATIFVERLHPLTTSAHGDEELVSYEELLADADSPAWLVQGVLPDGGLAVLAGEGGSGKGWLSLTLADAVARGEPWLGGYDVSRSGPAIIIDYERGRRYSGTRVKGLAAALGRAPEARYRFRPPKYDPAWIAGLVERHRPALVVIDSLTHLLLPGTKDTDNDAMAEVLGKLREIAEQYDCCVLVVHHFRKRGEFGDSRPIARVKGAVAIANTADVVLCAWRTREQRIHTEVAKSFWGDPALPFLCEWQSGERGGTMLVLGGEAEPERVTKIEQAQEIILSALEIDSLSRDELKPRCAAERISERTMDEAIKRLKRADRIRPADRDGIAVYGLAVDL